MLGMEDLVSVWRVAAFMKATVALPILLFLARWLWQAEEGQFEGLVYFLSVVANLLLCPAFLDEAASLRKLGEFLLKEQ